MSTMGTLTYSPNEIPSVPDGIKTGRYIECTIVGKRNQSFGNVSVWCKIPLLQKNQFIVFMCLNRPEIKINLIVGKKYIVDKLEFAHGGIHSHIVNLTYHEPRELDFNTYSSYEVLDIFAGPHSINFVANLEMDETNVNKVSKVVDDAIDNIYRKHIRDRDNTFYDIGNMYLGRWFNLSSNLQAIKISKYGLLTLFMARILITKNIIPIREYAIDKIIEKYINEVNLQKKELLDTESADLVAVSFFVTIAIFASKKKGLINTDLTEEEIRTLKTRIFQRYEFLAGGNGCMSLKGYTFANLGKL